MKAKYKVWLSILLGLSVCVCFAYYLTTVEMAVMNPKGIIGHKEKDLIVIGTYLMLIVVIPVFVMTFYIIWKYRASNKNAKYSPDWDNNHVAEAIWWGLPTVIIVILSILTWYASHDLDPFKPLDSEKKALRIQVVALQWKWLFIYPEQGIACLNELRFPAETPLHFEITSDAPMNSFWIPQLGGMIFAMSGMKTQLHLIAHEKGTYRGCSGNISGKGFAGMEFFAKASSQEDFDDWVNQAKQSGGLDINVYNKLAKPSEKDPVTLYSLEQDDLFDQSIMKYMAPMEAK